LGSPSKARTKRPGREPRNEGKPRDPWKCKQFFALFNKIMAQGEKNRHSVCQDRRKLADRRRRPTNPFSLHSFKGTRRVVRRREDRERYPYLDQYSPRLFLISLLILLFCVADAMYTLVHLSRGAVELNPLMRGLVEISPYLFFSVKFALMAAGLILLVIYRQHPAGRFVISGTVLLYGFIFLYQLWLFM